MLIKNWSRNEIPEVVSIRILPTEVHRTLMDREHPVLVHPGLLCHPCLLSYRVSLAVPVFIHENASARKTSCTNHYNIRERAKKARHKKDSLYALYNTQLIVQNTQLSINVQQRRRGISRYFE